MPHARCRPGPLNASQGLGCLGWANANITGMRRKKQLHTYESQETLQEQMLLERPPLWGLHWKCVHSNQSGDHAGPWGFFLSAHRYGKLAKGLAMLRQWRKRGPTSFSCHLHLTS